MMEPAITHVLRKYLTRMGPRPDPVMVTPEQIGQLEKGGFVDIDMAGVMSFEGQVIAIQDDASATHMRGLAHRVNRMDRDDG